MLRLMTTSSVLRALFTWKLRRMWKSSSLIRATTSRMMRTCPWLKDIVGRPSRMVFRVGESEGIRAGLNSDESTAYANVVYPAIELQDSIVLWACQRLSSTRLDQSLPYLGAEMSIYRAWSLQGLVVRGMIGTSLRSF